MSLAELADQIAGLFKGIGANEELANSTAELIIHCVVATVYLNQVADGMSIAAQAIDCIKDTADKGNPDPRDRDIQSFIRSVLHDLDGVDDE